MPLCQPQLVLRHTCLCVDCPRQRCAPWLRRLSRGPGILAAGMTLENHILVGTPARDGGLGCGGQPPHASSEACIPRTPVAPAGPPAGEYGRSGTRGAAQGCCPASLAGLLSSSSLVCEMWKCGVSQALRGHRAFFIGPVCRTCVHGCVSPPRPGRQGAWVCHPRRSGLNCQLQRWPGPVLTIGNIGEQQRGTPCLPVCPSWTNE